jgi:hypothetical protein
MTVSGPFRFTLRYARSARAIAFARVHCKFEQLIKIFNLLTHHCIVQISSLVCYKLGTYRTIRNSYYLTLIMIYPLVENSTFWKNWYSRNWQELSINYWCKKNCKIKNWGTGITYVDDNVMRWIFRKFPSAYRNRLGSQTGRILSECDEEAN